MFILKLFTKNRYINYTLPNVFNSLESWKFKNNFQFKKKKLNHLKTNIDMHTNLTEMQTNVYVIYEWYFPPYKMHFPKIF